MRVYITRANSMKILRKLDFSKMDLSGDVYNRPLFFLNKKEEQAFTVSGVLCKPSVSTTPFGSTVGK